MRSSERRGNGYAVSRDLAPRLLSVANLKGLGRATKKHPPHQVAKLAASLERFGFVLPILIDADGRVVAGWGLVLAAKRLGLNKVPAVTLSDVAEGELRALRLALNRLADDARWDLPELALEFSEILEIDPHTTLEITGFESGQIEGILGGSGIDQEDELPDADNGGAAITEPGDLWKLGEHRIYCGDALNPQSYEHLFGAENADMAFIDPPYNVPVPGHVSGRGSAKHGNFAMASGELSEAEFKQFLKRALSLAAQRSSKGAVHFVCMDWRHLGELSEAGRDVYGECLNLCIWRKSNAGMGSLYRSQHELIFVFKVDKKPHTNNVRLGKWGRHRTNVWDYVSQNALNGTNKSKLALHPTVKPVAMVADTILDCSHRGGLILDPFAGAGTTLIAAERTGRRARLIELDPKYVDVTIERWQRLTGGTAVHAVTGHRFIPTKLAKS
jgi:16S rRNA G966 N2-methylase RsmD